jgi:RIO kinase 1
LGKNKHVEQMQTLEEFIDQGVVAEVLGVIKSGKEATVYLCRRTDAAGTLIAAKLYRSRDVRGFRDDAVYREGRLRRKTREARAIETKTRKGREFAFATWVADEYATLSALHAAGGDVPAPFALSEHVILMEYLGTEDEPAPPLSAIRLDAADAQRLFDRTMWNVRLMLQCDRVHGDLSAFNVLYHEGGVRIIDFPQAVDARFNSSALTLLERDVERLCDYFGRFGVQADAFRITRELWGRYLRSEL